MSRELAIEGGAPVRTAMLPYGRQSIDDADIAAVTEVLRGDWLTTGPKVAEFEVALARATGATHAVAVNSGTAALHAAMHALEVGPRDEVIVPSLTFAATANAVLYTGGTPVFADVEADTLLLDVDDAATRITPRTKAIVAVDYAGQPCDYRALRDLCDDKDLRLVSDACHSLGGSFEGRPVGSLADLSCFSFHPVKHITTGEGGAVTTADATLAQRARMFRNHGITTDHRQRTERGAYDYDMVELGYNYRLTDLQCALGLGQLAKLGPFVDRRRALAAGYDRAFADLSAARPLATRPSRTHAYHLYVVQLTLERLRADRAKVFAALRAENIGVNVHYRPVHLHPYYRERLGTKPGMTPVAEAAYPRLLSLPMFATMTDGDADDVVAAMGKVTEAYA